MDAATDAAPLTTVNACWGGRALHNLFSLDDLLQRSFGQDVCST